MPTRKILILTRFVKEYEPRKLAETGRKLGFKVDLVKYGQISLKISKDKPDFDLGKKTRLKEYGLVIPRSASKKGSSMVATKTALLQAIAKNEKTKILNGDTFLRYPLLGKIEQGLEMARQNLPTVPFVSFGSKNGWGKFLKGKIDFPVMVKGRFGSHGRTVKLVDNKKELEKLIKSYSAGNVLIQPVLAINQWYRCIVVGKKYLGQMRHRQKSKYRLTTNQGKLFQLSTGQEKKLQDICLKAARVFKCDFAGLDVGWNKKTNNWVIFEVNRTPQFKYFEKRTRTNVSEAIYNHFLK